MWFVATEGAILMRIYDYKTSYSRPALAPEMAQRGNKRDAINGKGIWTSLGRGNKTITAI